MASVLVPVLAAPALMHRGDRIGTELIGDRAGDDRGDPGIVDHGWHTVRVRDVELGARLRQQIGNTRFHEVREQVPHFECRCANGGSELAVGGDHVGSVTAVHGAEDDFDLGIIGECGSDTVRKFGDDARRNGQQINGQFRARRMPTRPGEADAHHVGCR